MRPTRAPRRSTIVLVAIVELKWIVLSAPRKAGSFSPTAFAAASMHASKPIVRSCGVVSTFTWTVCSPSETKPSVNVPPVSMLIAYERTVISLHSGSGCSPGCAVPA